MPSPCPTDEDGEKLAKAQSSVIAEVWCAHLGVKPDWAEEVNLWGTLHESRMAAAGYSAPRSVPKTGGGGGFFLAV